MNLFDLAVIVSFVGLLVIIIGLVVEIVKNLKANSSARSEKGRTEVGGIIMIGPIPIVFGNSKDALKWAVVAVIFLFLLYIFLTMLVSYKL